MNTDWNQQLRTKGSGFGLWSFDHYAVWSTQLAKTVSDINSFVYIQSIETQNSVVVQ